MSDICPYICSVCDLQDNPIFITCNTLRLLKRSIHRYRATLRHHPGHVTSHNLVTADDVRIPARLRRKLIAENVSVKRTSSGIKLKAKKRLQVLRVLQQNRDDFTCKNWYYVAKYSNCT